MFGLHLFVREGVLMLASLAGLGALVGIGEILRAWGVSVRTTRRLVHAGVSIFVASVPIIFARPLPVYALAGFFVIINAGARLYRLWPGIHAARPTSWGTVALPLSVGPVLAATWSVSPERVFVVHVAYLVLGLADPAASWVGEMRQSEARVRSSTLAGSLTFACVALVLTGLLLATATPWSSSQVLGAALGTTLVATLVESISSGGWDNLFVVVAVGLVLVPLQDGMLTIVGLGGALFVGAAFAGGAYGTETLDGPGAATAGLFAASLVGLGGVGWIVPGLVFFGLSSALTGLHRREGAGSVPRTQRQVLANGGVAWIALSVTAVGPASTLSIQMGSYAAFVGALAAAAADTWATEVGKWAPSRPWSLREGRQVPIGTSGAVSFVGTGAAILGAMSVVAAALLSGDVLSAAPGPGRNALILGSAGVLGMVADSVAGAFVQAQYSTSGTVKWDEEPASPNDEPVRGSGTVGNNAVNLIGTTVGALGALGGVLLFG